MSNDAQVLEVRDSLFAMIGRISRSGSGSENPNQVGLKQRIVVDRLCMCVALVALNTVSSCWMNSVADIIKFGSDTPHNCYLALLILKAICQEAESQHFSNKQKSCIEINLRENLEQVLAFVCLILQTRSQRQLPLESYLEALTAAKSWCRFSTKTFVPNQDFIHVIFSMMENDQETFGKAISVVKKLLVESKFNKALEYNSESTAFSLIPEVDKQFLQAVVLYCINKRDVLVAETQKPFDETKDEELPFARKFTSLLTVLCSDYELLLIRETNESN